jgi:cytochrome c
MKTFLVASAILIATTATAFAADVEAGGKVFKAQCAACHSVVEHKKIIGPSMFGVVGRKAGTEDFAYSDANKNSGIVWTEAALDPYLTSPKTVVPGTKMTYAGLKNDEQRANLIAYLATVK